MLSLACIVGSGGSWVSGAVRGKHSLKQAPWPGVEVTVSEPPNTPLAILREPKALLPMPLAVLKKPNALLPCPLVVLLVPNALLFWPLAVLESPNALLLWSLA